MRAPDTAAPPVFVADSQFDVLFDLASAADTPAAHLLLEELDRASIVDDANPGRVFARLGDTIRYCSLDTRREHRSTLVTPDRSDIDRGRLSVLTPAGATLVGLQPGAVRRWTEPNGRRHALEVLEVVQS